MIHLCIEIDIFGFEINSLIYDKEYHKIPWYTMINSNQKNYHDNTRLTKIFSVIIPFVYYTLQVNTYLSFFCRYL